MQKDEYLLILKIFCVSALFSIGIKVIVPQLPLPQTNAVALMLVLIPTILLGLWLLIQQQRA